MAVAGKKGNHHLTSAPNEDETPEQETMPDDFETPNVVPGSNASYDLTQQPAEPEQQEDLPMETPPVVPTVIQNGKMLAEFVRPHFERDPDGNRFVGFEIAIRLTQSHEANGHLPPEVMREWQHMRDGGASRIDVIGVSSQSVAIGLVPDDVPDDLILAAATITKPVLALVEDKGSGKKLKIVRFSFRAVVDQIEEVARFAVDHHGEVVWVNLQRTQESLFENQNQS